LINLPFLRAGGRPDEYRAGIERAIEKGWLTRHRPGCYVEFTQAGADLFARWLGLASSTIQSPCPYPKSNPGILMMQSAQDRLADNTPGCIGGAWYRCILVQRQVSSRAIVVGHVRQQHVTQMAFAKHHDMINAFPADRADQPFCISVLPR